MSSTQPNTWSRTWSYIQNHTWASLTVGILLGVLFSNLAGAGNANSLEAALFDARNDRNSAEDEAASADDLLNDYRTQNSALKEQVTSLEDQLVRVNAKRPLPGLTGGRQASARELEEKYGWDLSVRYEFSSSAPGTVLEQSPAEGTEMHYGARFTVVVAKKIPNLPDFVGMVKGRAASRARQGGWQVRVVDQVSSARPGTVIAMSPSARSPLVPGSVITLTIAKKAPPPPPEPASVSSSSSGSGCTPGYSPCLPPASDYDCSGGSGDGPKYTGYVTVTGSDPYGLDADGDGIGCED